MDKRSPSHQPATKTQPLRKRAAPPLLSKLSSRESIRRSVSVTTSEQRRLLRRWIPRAQALALLLLFRALSPGADCPEGPASPQLVSERSTDEQYAHARCLATAGRRAEAEAALEAAARLAPNDARFPTELAGIAFLEQRYSAAKKHLKRALSLAPDDAYLIDFLATVYLLEDNLDAALLYWNRIGKPRLEQVHLATLPSDAVLLDRAVAFAPASTLRLSELELTRARLDHLDFYSRLRFDLLAREDQNYELRFQALERTGWGRSKLSAAVSLLRGLPEQTVHADFFDKNGRGLNVESLARWDSKKRRVNITVSKPVGRDPGRRLAFLLDARDEDWRFDSSGSAAAPVAFGMRKAEAGLMYSAVANHWLTWRSGVVAASRGFRDRAWRSAANAGDASNLFREGPSLNSVFGLELRLLRLPEHRLALDAAADWRLGRFWSDEHSLYSRWTQSLTLRWFPQASGGDYANEYAIEMRWRSGQTFGAAPFDEIYALGVDRDSDLWLRGHRATSNGYKGAALLGGRYLLWNSELDKTLYRHPLLKLTAGPFLDGGAIHDSRGGFGSAGWRWDSGVQCKATWTGGLAVAFSYGRNLQSGRDAFYWRIGNR